MRRIRLNILLLFLVASLVLMYLDSRGFLNGPKSIAQAVTAPVQFGVYRARLGTGEFFSIITFWKSGEARIRNLEQRNLELIGFESEAKILDQENQELRKQLGVSKNSLGLFPEKLLPARILGKGQYLNIGAGMLDGVKEGDAVVYLDNLAGKVVRATDRVSFVQMPTDSQAKIPVKIGRVFGLVSGQFNSSIVLDHVAQNEEINTGDLVLTSGEGGSYWPNLVVGKIKKIESQKTDLFQRAEVVSLIDYDKLTTVFVITGQ